QYSINGHGGATIIQDCPFFGNISFKKNERQYQEIKYGKYNEIDLTLVKKLFMGEQINDNNQINCTFVISQSYKRKQFTQGNIIEKPCSIHFIKIIPLDISSCPYIALICIGTHKHLLPLPKKIPANLKISLQNLIKQAINNNETLTPSSFIV
ncbi:39234_t:CDS:2, partial [Gigaspora margarita]